MSDKAVNSMTGEELSLLVSEKHSLSTLKIGGCSNLGFINLSSSSLEVLWLSDLCSLSKAVILCSISIYSNNNSIFLHEFIGPRICFRS